MSISTIYTHLRIKFLHLSVYGRQAHHHNLNVKILLQRNSKYENRDFFIY